MKKIKQLSTKTYIYEELITTIFKPLSEQDKSLPTRITQYILHGNEIDVLVDLEKLCQIPNNANNLYELLHRPAEFYCPRSYYRIGYKFHPSFKARIDVYKSWTDTFTSEQIIRFAQVFATLFDHLSFIKRISEQLPSWFIYLLYDGLISTLPYPNWNENGIIERENWSIQQLHQFLEIEQQGLGEKLLFAIFDRQNITINRFDLFQHFTRLNGLLTYIQERIELFKQLPSHGLALFGQVEQLKYIQRYPELQLQLIDFLAMQALNTSKQVSQLATEILFNLPYVAQDALRQIPNIHNQIEQTERVLSSPKQEVRIAAANWLAELGQKSSIKALNEALKKEKRETVQAAILIALEKIGEDISQHLTPKKLLADAQKGLKGKIPTDFDWFDFNLIPTLTWQNGKTVEPQIIQWWICLAVKLRDPANLLLTVYNRLLSTQSQRQLGEFILRSFINQDTQTPTLEEAEAKASSEANKRLQDYIGYYQRYPKQFSRYQNITYEQVFEEIKNETLAIYLGSAIKSKGILALTCGIEGSIAVSLLRSFMKNHYQRRAQIEAMLEPLANSDDPLIIQLLLSLARRYRMASIQEKAKYLVESIAQRSGWSTEELADRTISTAGLDDNGLLILDYGERTFTASLDDKFKWQLKNADGEKIKALPEARKNENPELVKEAKKQFSNSKKELNQLLTMQISRFYEAMCAQRQWRVEDWQKYLQPHPIVGRFIQRLVWLQLDNNGQIVNSFRPTEDGSLITNQDDEILLDQNHFIFVAHSALLASDDIAQWQAHLEDYKITPLFEQFSHAFPEISKFNDGVIDDRLGWLTDSFTIRGILTKLNYERDTAEDGGCFYGYHKYFGSLGIYINIEFSGSMLPEENIPAVLYNLYFSNKKGFKDRAIALDKLPKVLLTEGYADYMAVAKACSGFDPNWKDKLIW